MKRLIKGIFALACLIAIGLGIMNVYFHRVYPIAPALRTAAAEQIQVHHVHMLSDAQIPLTYKNAVISTEDRRFYSDPGIDPIGILRSVVVDIQRDGYVEGGSTITQQLVDNTLLNKQKTLARKVMQMLYAIGIYDTMSKSEVLTLYANVIYFGHGAYGLYNAAETYFHRTPSECNEGELTLLAGLPNAPSVYDPFRALTLARQRQHVVLENMVDAGLITHAQATKIYAEPLRLRSQG